MNAPRDPSRHVFKLLVAALIVALALAAIWGLNRNRFGSLVGRKSTDAELFAKVRQALNATESLQNEAANETWDSLYDELPDDPSVTLNRALNRLLDVESLVRVVREDSETPASQEAALAKLPEALQRARRAIEDHAQAGAPSGERLWLASRVDLSEAGLVEPQQGNAIRKRVLDAVSAWANDEGTQGADAAALAGVWLQAYDEAEMSGQDPEPEQAEVAAKTVRRFTELQPDNLYLALRAARLGIVAQDPNASSAVAATRRLARAIEPTLQATTQAIGLTPDQLTQQISDAITKGSWPEAQQKMNLWFNVLNGTELVKTDRKRASPHPLDRISYTTMRGLARQLNRGEPTKNSGQGPLKFEPFATAPAGATGPLAAVDIDLDLRPEVVQVSDSGQIVITRIAQGSEVTSEVIAQLTTDFTCAGLLAADLFMVDATDPNRLQATTPAAKRSEEGTNAKSPVPTDKAAAPPARHTTYPSLVLYGADGVRLIAIDGRPATGAADRLSLVPPETGLEGLKDVTAAVAGDLDGDGDLDLAFGTRDDGLRVFVNRGNRTFFESKPDEGSGFAENSKGIVSMSIADLDRDLDLDLVCLLQDSGKVALAENLLHLQFRFRELTDVTPTPGATFLKVGDYDGNVSWDLAIVAPDQTRVYYSQTPAANDWRVEQTDSMIGSASPLIADWDNDTWHEILLPGVAAVSGEGTKAGTAAAKRLEGAGVGTELQVVTAPPGRWVAAADFDLDGRADILSAEGGRWRVDRNTTEPAGNYLDLRFRGIDDNNAASGRVNHYAIGSVIEAWFGTNYRAAIVTEPMTHFGLGGFETADSMRVIFPNGLTQTVSKPSRNSVVEEEQTLKGSCPYLYAWNGERFEFVTDCLWAAPLGLQVARNVVAPDRPWEYLKVDGKHVVPKDGHYELRITEELWEVAYIDQIELTTIDHPATVDVWTNEKVGPAEIAAPMIHAFATRDALAIRRGLDTQGRDVTDELTKTDGRFVKAFDTRLRQGLCPPHWIDLDFGPLPEAPANARTFLVVTGWILPTDSSLNIQIDQNPDLPSVEYPSVWVPDPSSATGWREAIPFMGFPGGKTKTIVVDVSDCIVRSDPRLRVKTSAQIYWDSAQLIVRQETAPIETRGVPLVSAELVARGFSAKSKATDRSPETYDYDQLLQDPKWPPLGGHFTDLGDRFELVREWDDAMVVMAPGDELRLRFRVPQEPLPAGWERDFVLHCVGWDKDADLNTLAGQSSEPIPFKGMKAYPPGPDQSAEAEQVERLNRPHTRRTQSFRRFWSPLINHRGG
jgi:hypothetical protein